MADGYARAKGVLGVVAVHGSPGAHNVVTAVKTASCENVPLLCVSGDVPTSLARRQAFHNTAETGTDDAALFAGMTKFSKRVRSVAALPQVLEQAIETATTRPYGPVHLLVPFDILCGDTGVSQLTQQPVRPCTPADKDDSAELFLEILRSKRRVVLWAGDSMNEAGIARNLRSVAERFEVPVITTYDAKGVLPEDHSLCFGNLGFGGNSRAQALLESGEVEVILALDVDWNERNTANWAPFLTDGIDIHLFHQSPVIGELDSVQPTPCDTRRLLADVAEMSQADQTREKPGVEWPVKIAPRCEPVPSEQTNGCIQPETIVRTMRRVLAPSTMLFVDAGLHRIYAGKYWKAFEPGTFFSSSVMAATGWAIAAGIGAKLDEDRDVVILTGDGCMGMNGMGLITAVEYEIPVTVVIMDNGGFASITKRLADTEAAARGDFTFRSVDWAALARSLGAEGHRIETREALADALAPLASNAAVRVLSVATPLMPNLDASSGDRSAYA
jgi:acetolactate synthase-1/2/3 large subunit